MVLRFGLGVLFRRTFLLVTYQGAKEISRRHIEWKDCRVAVFDGFAAPRNWIPNVHNGLINDLWINVLFLILILERTKGPRRRMQEFRDVCVWFRYVRHKSVSYLG